jgi:hypothetical protein
VVSLILLPISMLSSVLLATSPFSLAALIAVEGRSVMPIASAGLLVVLFVCLLVFFAGLYSVMRRLCSSYQAAA